MWSSARRSPDACCFIAAKTSRAHMVPPARTKRREIDPYARRVYEEQNRCQHEADHATRNERRRGKKEHEILHGAVAYNPAASKGAAGL